METWFSKCSGQSHEQPSIRPWGTLTLNLFLLPPLEFRNRTSDNGERSTARGSSGPSIGSSGSGSGTDGSPQCLQTQRELPTQPHEHLSPTQPHSQEQCGVYASSFFPLTSESCHGSGGSVCSGGRFSARGQFRIDRERVPGPNSWRGCEILQNTVPRGDISFE